MLEFRQLFFVTAMKVWEKFLFGVSSLFLLACTKTPPPIIVPIIDARTNYQNEVDQKLTDWRTILEDLRSHRNRQPVNSPDYATKGEAVHFLEAQLTELTNKVQRLKSAPDSGWADYRAEIDAKLFEMKNLYFRPAAE